MSWCSFATDVVKVLKLRAVSDLERVMAAMFFQSLRANNNNKKNKTKKLRVRIALADPTATGTTATPAPVSQGRTVTWGTNEEVGLGLGQLRAADWQKKHENHRQYIKG